MSFPGYYSFVLTIFVSDMSFKSPSMCRFPLHPFSYYNLSVEILHFWTCGISHSLDTFDHILMVQATIFLLWGKKNNFISTLLRFLAETVAVTRPVFSVHQIFNIRYIRVWNKERSYLLEWYHDETIHLRESRIQDSFMLREEKMDGARDGDPRKGAGIFKSLCSQSILDSLWCESGPEIPISLW